MADFHFITDPIALNLISTIADIAGPNFNMPYDSSSQPSDSPARNDEVLVQYDVPGGTTIRSTANPATSADMSWVLSSLLQGLSPIISAYGLILPIIGVIRGIIEILCCLMNPFCVVRAVKKLFVKWIPPFVSLFPPIAGLVLIASTIKLIIAMIFYILTELVPTLELVKKNIEVVLDSIDPEYEARREAAQQKLLALATGLANRLGVLSVAKPLFDIIFAILELVAGFPCDKGNTEDTSCCDDVQCPPEISDPASGKALLMPKFYGDAPQLWTWALYPFSEKTKVKKLIPYLQNLISQLNPQLDEEIDEARPAGSTYDAAHFRVRIVNRRGIATTEDETTGSLLVPVAKITSGGNIIVTNHNLIKYMGVIEYAIEPNFDQLVGKNIIAVSCHPEILAAKDAAVEKTGLSSETSAGEKAPASLEVPDIYNELSNTLIDGIDSLKNDFNSGIYDAGRVDNLRDDLTSVLFNSAEELTRILNEVLLVMVDNISSTLTVDKNVVRAGGTDKAIITVVPKDLGEIPIARNLPDGADLNVEIFTDFGTIQNQSRNNSTGAITADLISAFPGKANITAKINTDFVSETDGTTVSVKTETVTFVADAIMPKRRKVSKSSGTKIATGSTTEREPGSR